MPSRNVSRVEPTAEEIDLSSVLIALSDPLRLGIVVALDNHREDVACGAFDLPVAKSTSSHHLRVLREAGVLDQYDEGTRRFNRLRRDDLDLRFPGLLDLVIAEGRRVTIPILSR